VANFTNPPLYSHWKRKPDPLNQELGRGGEVTVWTFGKDPPKKREVVSKGAENVGYFFTVSNRCSRKTKDEAVPRGNNLV